MIEWTFYKPKNSCGIYTGTVGGEEVAEIYGKDANYMSFWSVEQGTFITLEAAKQKAESLFQAWLDEAELMVKPIVCPNPYCGNSGVYPTEPDGEPEQCEFCYREENSVFNFMASLEPERPEPQQQDSDLPF